MDNKKKSEMVENAPENGIVKQIGNTIFDIHIHFSETSRETFTDKVVRLIQNEKNA